MIFIKHRVNQQKDLSTMNKDWGCEIDLRSNVKNNGKIHLSHDAWTEGEDFEQWLNEFKKQNIQGPLILNTKEDGLEEQSFLLMQKYKIENFIFLDTQLPTLVKYMNKNLGKYFFLRQSFYEPTELLAEFPQIDWIWLDCFHQVPLDAENYKMLSLRYNFCLVSPELQGGDLLSLKSNFTNLAQLCKAICTKQPTIWNQN